MTPRPSTKAPLGLTVAALLLTACIPLDTVEDPALGPFDALHKGDLSQAEQRLAHRAQRGATTSLDPIAYDLIALATCVEPASFANITEVNEHTPEHLLASLIALEDTRRLRLIRQSLELPAERRAGWHKGTIHSTLTSRDAFNTEPADPPEDTVTWPAHTERWPGERPAAVDIDWACESLGKRARDISSHTWLARESDQTRTVLERLDTSPLPDLGHVHEALSAHLVDLSLLRLERDSGASDPLTIVSLARERAHVTLAADDALHHIQRVNDRAPSPGTLARQASLAMATDDIELASDALRLLSEEVEGPIALAARYLRLRLLWLQGRFDEAAELALPLPPPQSGYFEAHAYFGVTALRRSGRTDAFFGAAREALRDRDRAKNPYLGAVYQEVLRELATYQVDARTFEILEEFGPRNKLLERTAELADVAIDAGRPRVAESLALHLLNEDRDARRRPRYHATQALAAFLLDDAPAFVDALRLIAPRPDAIMEVIPAGRRATFFAEADAQLARVLRAALPLMAEWGDTPADQARRQRWLSLMIEELQRFMRTTPDSAVGDELQELYHLAGELLDDHPRGYAERVGRDEATALILGTVHVPPAYLALDAPNPRMSWPSVRSLLIVPRDQGQLSTWPTGFDFERDERPQSNTSDEQPAEAP
ncbi:hypothetical protein FRC98_01330 [Lujinxingia vulgaris]|uniref:Tetratricopeptide repeat protein n=1 Tax=Lujinxingia vulgaris TaxID=2600176 RepID=A0A5C6XLJ0_9DELT|nr:hypothetical protein [Lujinxingia vulgaris]TXD39075.1 hypothetical protein FRC98_01330 [Lujinxingia vulgaris]